MKYLPASGSYRLLNGYAIHPALGTALDGVARAMGRDWMRCKSRVDNGWTAGATSASGGTHAGGYAVDFDHVELLGRATVLRLMQALRSNGVQAVLRIPGDNVGAKIPIRSYHVHAALNGHSNAAALANVTIPGGKWSDKKQLARLPR